MLCAFVSRLGQGNLDLAINYARYQLTGAPFLIRKPAPSPIAMRAYHVEESWDGDQSARKQPLLNCGGIDGRFDRHFRLIYFPSPSGFSRPSRIMARCRIQKQGNFIECGHASFLEVSEMWTLHCPQPWWNYGNNYGLKRTSGAKMGVSVNWTSMSGKKVKAWPPL